MAFTYSGTMQLKGLSEFITPLNAKNNTINNLLNPVSAQQPATKNYVDTLIGSASTAIKTQVRVATAAALPTYTGTGTLTATVNGALTVDGVTPLTAGDRVLVKDEATTARNGIYTVSAPGSVGTPWVLARAIDANTAALLPQGFIVAAYDGTANAKTIFMETAKVVTIEVSPVVFAATSGGGGGGSSNIFTTVAYLASTTSGTVIDITKRRATFTATAVPGPYSMILPAGVSGQVLDLENISTPHLVVGAKRVTVTPSAYMDSMGDSTTVNNLELDPGMAACLVYDATRSAWMERNSGTMFS